MKLPCLYRGSAEREYKSFHARIGKLDLELLISDVRLLLSLELRINRFPHLLALDKLLGDGPELLCMVGGESIWHIAGEG
jgi:hypothetical protein